LSIFFRHFLHFLFQLGYFGPLVMGMLDSSFLFLPFGNDLLIVGLIARRHQGFILYVLSAASGSTLGVLLLDLVARKVGEEGIKRVASSRRFAYLKRKIGEKGGRALLLACLAPPPFPFTMVVATNSALGYPRRRLLWMVWLGRALRFTLVGLLALKFGRGILRIANSPGFRWSMIVFIVICMVGSVFSITNWVRKSRRAKTPA
jgi:membrane protein YqaA with SNARE-associated domain